MFKKLKSNKGVAMEMAIVTLLVLYSICFVLYVVSFKQKVRDTYENHNIQTSLNIEQVGEYFILSCKNKAGETYNYNTSNYYSLVNSIDDGLELKLYEKETDIIVLIVQFDTNENKVIKWYFDDPVNDTNNPLFDAD